MSDVKRQDASRLRTFRRQNAGISNYTNPSLASSNISTLANPTRGFGLPINNTPLETITEVTGQPLAGQPANEQLAKTETIQEKPLSYDISRISLHRPQAKLAVGEPNDQYEQEADRVANQVMRMVVSDKLNAPNELMAHELTHVVQQAGNNGFGQPYSIQKQGKKNSTKPVAQTNFKVENKTYTITAKTLQEAADQISQREEAGETSWNPKYTLKTDENGDVTDAMVDITITVTMPTWPNAAKLSKPAKAEWERAFKVLKAHEEKHVKLVRSKLNDLAKSLVGKSRTEAEATFEAALTELKQSSDEYDTQSNHGRNEGTDLDISVEPPSTIQPALQ
jgi:predicted secreted Zn-dependent protease